MSTLIWTWAFTWLCGCLWLDWRVNNEWLPGTDDLREERNGGLTPPPDALTPLGERLWRRRYQVTLYGLLGWCALVAIAAIRALAHV